MFQIDKERFGSFVAACRREKGLTQKQLAQQLYVSDKAVSKWERGLSLPDISLLQPLAQALGLSVAELLEGRRLSQDQQMGLEQAEALVGKALSFSPGKGERAWQQSRRRNLLWASFFLLACLETLCLVFWAPGGFPAWSGLLTYQCLSLVFGCYFWLAVRLRLPDYYDQNRISAYYDGPFRLSLGGVALNNRNWPKIVRAGQIWSAASALLLPFIYGLGLWLAPDFWSLQGSMILLVLWLLALFVPLYRAANR